MASRYLDTKNEQCSDWNANLAPTWWLGKKANGLKPVEMFEQCTTLAGGSVSFGQQPLDAVRTIQP